MTDQDRRNAMLAARAARPAPTVAAAPVSASEPAPQTKMTRPPTDARAPVPPEGRVVFRKDDFEVKQVPKGTKAPSGGFRGADGRSAPGGPTIVGGPGAKNRNRPDAAKFEIVGSRGNPNIKSVGGRHSNVQIVERVNTQSKTGVVATATVPRVDAPVATGPRGPSVDLTVVLGYHARPDVIEPQQRLLIAQSVTPQAVIAWLNPHAHIRIPPHVLATLMRMPCVQPNVDMGPWMRWGVASQCPTEFVAVLDDDTMPGPRWLEAAIARLQSGNEFDIVAAGGLLYSSDHSSDARLVGPEVPPAEEVDVDVGRGGWVMRTATARLIASQPRPIETLSTGLHIASVAQEQEALTTVLPYGRDRATWGMLEPPRREGSVGAHIDQDFMAQRVPHGSDELREMIFRAYRKEGWLPWCVILADAAAQMDTVRLEASEVVG